MPLSEHEQRILEEMERRLAEEDPRPVETVARTTVSGHALRRVDRLVTDLELHVRSNLHSVSLMFLGSARARIDLMQSAIKSLVYRVTA